MPHKNIQLTLLSMLIIVVAATGFWLAKAPPTKAQCGSQASSCKSCHEVQGQTPVNGDSTAWHTSHAFGDFCYICHAGNNQAKDKTDAHAGMAPPLSDIKASCQQCHPNDLEARAKVYADALGVEVGAGGAPAASSEPASREAVSNDAAAISTLLPVELDVNDPNLVDFARHYDEVVLGKKPINVGNAILLVLIGMVAVGGGGFVVTREKLVRVTFGETRKPDSEYPADVVEMLSGISKLKTNSRKSLKSILDTPQKADKVLDLIEAVMSDEKGKE